MNTVTPHRISPIKNIYSYRSVKTYSRIPVFVSISPSLSECKRKGKIQRKMHFLSDFSKNDFKFSLINYYLLLSYWIIFGRSLWLWECSWGTYISMLLPLIGLIYCAFIRNFANAFSFHIVQFLEDYVVIPIEIIEYEDTFKQYMGIQLLLTILCAAFSTVGTMFLCFQCGLLLGIACESECFSQLFRLTFYISACSRDFYIYGYKTIRDAED